jgi:hypothetical protein
MYVCMYARQKTTMAVESMYGCICICMYTYVCVCVCIVLLCLNVYVHVCMVSVYLCIHVSMYRASAPCNMQVCIYLRTYVCMYQADSSLVPCNIFLIYYEGTFSYHKLAVYEILSSF